MEHEPQHVVVLVDPDETGAEQRAGSEIEGARNLVGDESNGLRLSPGSGVVRQIADRERL
jgi:hypothetical protein